MFNGHFLNLLHFLITGWLCGAQTTFDTAKGKLLKNNFSMGLAAKEFILNTSM